MSWASSVGGALEDGDGGHIGYRLGGGDVGVSHLARLDVKQVEGADHGASQPHGQGVHRVEAGGERLGRKGQRPLTVARSWFTTGWPVR